jgi:phosphoribosylanthranilate isomerase
MKNQDQSLKIKICGMREPANIMAVARLAPEYMGFIYYPRSKRYAGELSPDVLLGIRESIRKTGVFLDASVYDVLSISARMGFQAIQLHGKESPDECQLIRKEGYELLKVFNMGMQGAFDNMDEYLEVADLFLFDSGGQANGGTGLKFDWEQLENYHHDTPYMISGGIGADDADKLLSIRYTGLYGADLNSRFETQPGVKNIQALAGFIQKIRSA